MSSPKPISQEIAEKSARLSDKQKVEKLRGQLVEASAMLSAVLRIDMMTGPLFPKQYRHMLQGIELVRDECRDALTATAEKD